MKPADPRRRRAAIAKGKRRATAYGDEARGPEHTGHQQTDGLRQKDGAEVSAQAGDGSPLWPAGGATQQAGLTKAIFARPDEGRCVERPGATEGTTAAWLSRRLYDFERLAAAA